LPDYQPKAPEYAYLNKDLECSYDGCAKPADSLSLCAGHYQQHQRGLELRPIRVSRAERGCREDGCDRPHEAHGYCNTHYIYAVGRADLQTASKRQAINRDGYVRLFIPGHPNAQKTGYVLAHHVVMAELIGRPIARDETVHHKNGHRGDNRPENLELWVSRQCKGQRVEDLVTWAKELLMRYEPEALAQPS